MPVDRRARTRRCLRCCSGVHWRVLCSDCSVPVLSQQGGSFAVGVGDGGGKAATAAAAVVKHVLRIIIGDDRHSRSPPPQYKHAPKQNRVRCLSLAARVLLINSCIPRSLTRQNLSCNFVGIFECPVLKHDSTKGVRSLMDVYTSITNGGEHLSG